MRARLLIGAGFAAGYVLGARAGRARYDAILGTVRRLKDDPSLQGTAGLLQAQVAGAVVTTKRVIGGTVAGVGGHASGAGNPPSGEPRSDPGPPTRPGSGGNR